MYTQFEYMIDITKLSVQLIRYVFKAFKYFAPFEIPFIPWARQCPNLVYIGFGNLKRIGFKSPMDEQWNERNFGYNCQCVENTIKQSSFKKSKI